MYHYKLFFFFNIIIFFSLRSPLLYYSYCTFHWCLCGCVYICRYILFYTEREWCSRRYFLLLGLQSQHQSLPKGNIKNHPPTPCVPKSPLFGFVSGTDKEQLRAEPRGQSEAAPEWVRVPPRLSKGESGGKSLGIHFYLIIYFYFFFSAVIESNIKQYSSPLSFSSPPSIGAGKDCQYNLNMRIKPPRVLGGPGAESIALTAVKCCSWVAGWVRDCLLVFRGSGS